MDQSTCYRAVSSRDNRFDGVFFTGVRTTGIYCRPSCPAPTPKPDNVAFYATAASAQAAGFRACRRCRPDATPGSPEWNVRTDLVARAMRLISDGLVDREGVPGLARALGYTDRHVHRMMTAELGVGPLAVARAHRAQTARILLENTALTATEIAYAAGFGSVRQFNDTVVAVYAATPTALRGDGGEPGTIRLRLAARQPLASGPLLEFLGRRAMPGIESWDGTTYGRTLRLPRGTGTCQIRAHGDGLHATLRLGNVRDLTPAVQRLRRLLDLDADPQAVDEALGGTQLAPLIGRLPGLRSPGTTDPHEQAVRAIVGQQVSVIAATRAAARLAEGAAVFPSAEQIAARDPESLGMPRRRARAVVSLCAALAEGRLSLHAGVDRDEAERRLLEFPGIGPWTASYIRLRALADPDVMLPTDLGVQRAAARLNLNPDDPELHPWRSYALHHLWNA